MKKILFISLLGLTGCGALSGCAHQTLYERCSKNNEFQRYGSMDQCISEKREDDSKKGHAFDGLAKKRTVTCTTFGNTTTCN